MTNINQLTTNNIKIPSKDLEILKTNFSHCFNKKGNFDFEKFKQELSKNEDIDFSNESYGMDWLGKSYARLLANDEATTLLKENKEWNKKPENKNSDNLLIKGDNLEVLKHLSNAYNEKIKMIYIDPPYNTGGDGFVYQDDRKFSVEELSKLAGIDNEKAKRILDFTQSKSNSHSAWLTFMYPRLYIAKQLLKDDGVIFVSIDDNEVAQLRILMDEIFGEENFVEIFIWDKKNSAKGVPTKNMVVNIHEYILCYSKSTNSKLFGEERTKDTFSNPDNDERGIWRLSNIKSTLENSEKFSIIDPKTGNKFTNYWAFSKESLKKMIEENRIVFPKELGGLPKQKEFFNEFKNANMPIKSNLGLFHAQDTYEEAVDEMLGPKVFPYRKPTNLIKKIVSQAGEDSEVIILDFFAGSGTTGDAVMQLNVEDDGNRKYILVQLPEVIDSQKNKTAYDFVKNELKIENPTIFDITKERLVRAGNKIKEDNNKLKEPKDLSSIDFGFKIFETISNNKGNWGDYILEAENFNSQTKLFDEKKLSKEDLEILLITWKTYDGFSLTKNLKEIDLDGYKGCYLDNKLYLIDKGFETKNLKKLLEEIDINKEFNPAIIIVFGYNFQSKILREIADNVKNYANKKHIDIDFIIRY
ncbi:MAG: site-specific DNA-methyltransferase [Candidatus ainarchaeum sp.]|nr:site-specific DNA-methyltransferase [Candidatus ainarchaeum sp.]